MRGGTAVVAVSTSPTVQAAKIIRPFLNDYQTVESEEG